MNWPSNRNCLLFNQQLEKRVADKLWIRATVLIAREVESKQLEVTTYAGALGSG